VRLGSSLSGRPRTYAPWGLRSSPLSTWPPAPAALRPSTSPADESVHFQTVASVQLTTGGERGCPGRGGLLAVVVAAADHVHRDTVMAALERDLDVLVEKPLATSS
jgi:hypothetical protein